MNRILYIIAFLSIFIFSSCQDVIELDIPESEKRLVVDSWLSNVQNIQTVKLKYTGPYFDSTAIPVVSGATVTIYDNQGNVFNMTEGEAGSYHNDFIPQVGSFYTLEIETPDGEKFISNPEKMEAVPEMEELYYEYKEKTLFDEEGYYVFIGFNDPEGVMNFYRWKLYLNDELKNAPFDLIISDDGLYDGAEVYDVQYNEDPLIPGDKVKIEMYSLTKEAYNYLNLVREQITSGRGLFDAPPAVVKGNMKKVNNPDEIVLGYFGVSEVDTKEIVIEEIE